MAMKTTSTFKEDISIFKSSFDHPDVSEPRLATFDSFMVKFYSTRGETMLKLTFVPQLRKASTTKIGEESSS